MMDKMRMESENIAETNVDKIAELFPNCITEVLDKEKSTDEKKVYKKVVNFELLRQMLTEEVEEGTESYEFTWVGKKAAIAEANKPIRKTLRPCIEASNQWNTTKNIYIEGDNLDVLKLLQESYLNLIKVIYIDPPYNTGHDFVYPDSFMMDNDEYNEGTGYFDEDGNVNYKRENNTSMARYHSDWCSMIYSRLLLSRNLLRDDGVIFISIDENEISNAKKIAEEVFGAENCLGVISNTNNPKGRSDDKFIATAHEYILVFARDIQRVEWFGFEPTEEITKRYNKVDEKGRKYREIDLRKTGENDLREDRPNLFYYFYFNETSGAFYPSREDVTIDGFIQIKPQREDGKEGNWRWGLETAEKQIEDLVPKFMPTRKVWGIMQKDYLEGRALVKPTTSWTFKDVNSERGTEEFVALGFDKRVFPKPKPVGTIKRCIKLSSNSDDDIILDFFGGSSTTAQAVMEKNAEDGISRNYILVQVPETIDEGEEAYKEGYRYITDIGKERIRRVCQRLDPNNTSLDLGFRVFKLDDSNMNDVYYSAGEYSQDFLGMLESNVKSDRTDLDLLFGCLLEWGLPLSMPYTSEEIEGYKVHTYNEGDLIACFDENIPDSVIKEIARRQPLRAVFRDSSFKGSPSKINVGEIFKMLAPDTRVKVI